MAFISFVCDAAEPNVRPERHGPSDFPDDLTMKEAPSFCAGKGDLGDHWLSPGKCVSKGLGVMVDVDHGVTRLVMCVERPTILPSQEPAIVFIISNAFCASDCGPEVLGAGIFIS